MNSMDAERIITNQPHFREKKFGQLQLLTTVHTITVDALTTVGSIGNNRTNDVSTNENDDR